MKKATRAALAVATIALTLTGCTITPAPSESPTVNWSNYSPEVHDRVDAAVKAGDCLALQVEFNVADEHHSTDLMGYLDGAMTSAGCY